MISALRLSRSSSTSRAVLCALLLLADETGEVERLTAEIAAVAGIQIRAARRCLRELGRLGEIRTLRHAVGRGNPNRYQLLVVPFSAERSPM